MTEEERAEAYRESLANRYAYRQAQAASLAGDPDALAELTENWEPLIAALKEKSYGYAEPEQHEPKKPGTLGGWQPV